jgi:hypothetical protein
MYAGLKLVKVSWTKTGKGTLDKTGKVRWTKNGKGTLD